MSLVMPVASTIDFPSSDPSSRLVTHPIPHFLPPHLPFRRISLPTPPTSIGEHRESVVSVASFDSLPEESTPSPGTPTTATAALVRNANVGRKSKGRPLSVETARRGSRKRESKPIDEARESRRYKVIQEFYETEKAYVDGLDLIYEVRPLLVCKSYPDLS
jgi:FYVE/RhoGEF/PH domain-containing protein 5/6